MRREHDPELELATADALRGTADLRRRLLLAISAGNPSIMDLAYAIKIRVKDDFKIIEKVIRKREEKDKEYSVERIRDVIGLRIVTLYRLESLNIIPMLLDVIADNSGHGQNNLFLNDPIEEVIVYLTNPKGDAQNLVGRLRPIFSANGLIEKFDVSDTPSNYSSIHLVVWGRGKYKDSYRQIPIEIQVRTAFEDTWGEIDHRLKYKRAINMTPEEEAKTANVLAHLNVMKTMIDGLAQYADQIKIQMDEPQEIRLKSMKLRLAEGPMEALEGLEPIDKDISDEIKEVVGLCRLVAEPEGGEIINFGSRLTAYRRATEELSVLRSSISIHFNLSDIQKKRILYLLDMEKAFLLFEYGNSLGGSAGNEALVDASRIYSQLEPDFPNSAVVKYRLARVLYALGDETAAIGKWQEIVASIDNLELGPTHWIRAAAPRALGVMYWQQALEIKPEPDEDDPSSLSRIKSLIGEAFKVTKSILTLTGGDENDPKDFSAPVERRKTLNNLLFFAVEMVEIHGDVDVSDFNYLAGDALRFLREVEQFVDVSTDNVRHAHTLMRAYRLVNQGQEAAAAAERVEELLRIQGVTDRGGSSREEVMLREARTVLAIDAITGLDSALS